MGVLGICRGKNAVITIEHCDFMCSLVQTQQTVYWLSVRKVLVQ